MSSCGSGPSLPVSGGSTSASNGPAASARSGRSSSTPIAEAFSNATSPTPFDTPMFDMSELTTSSPSMSSAAASPAKTSALPAPAEASKESDPGFGRSTPESFANFDPVTCSWRTSQLSLLEGSEPFSETWPRAGMTRNGTAYRLQPLVPITAVIGFGSLPTPRQQDAKHATATDYELSRDRQYDLLHVRLARESWPTPTKSDATGGPGNSGRSGGVNLRTAVRDSGERGPLNPTWVEWLMGFPIGWTDLGRLATRSSRRSRSGSGGASSTTSEAA